MTSLAELLTSHTQQMSKIGEENKALNGLIERLADENKALSGTIEKLVIENIALSGRVERLVIENIALSGRVERLVIENIALSGRVEILVIENKALSWKDQVHDRELANTQSENKELSKLMKRQTKEITTLRNDISHVQTQISKNTNPSQSDNSSGKSRNNESGYSKRIVMHSDTDILRLVTTHSTEIQKLQTDVAALSLACLKEDRGRRILGGEEIIAVEMEWNSCTLGMLLARTIEILVGPQTTFVLVQILFGATITTLVMLQVPYLAWSINLREQCQAMIPQLIFTKRFMMKMRHAAFVALGDQQ